MTVGAVAVATDPTRAGDSQLTQATMTGPGPTGAAAHAVGTLGGGASPALGDALRQVTDALAALTQVLGVSGGGPTAPPPTMAPSDGAGGCTCPSSSGAEQGRADAPVAEPPKGDPPAAEAPATEPPKAEAPAPAPVTDAPAELKPAGPLQQLPGETSHANLTDKSKQVLQRAHDAGLKLISGHRPGDDGGHGNGSAVDIANVPGGSREGSPEMERFAEEMRAAGRAGDPNVGYVIYRQRIASAASGWEWKPMEDRGSNTQNHFDHVHVSTDPNR